MKINIKISISQGILRQTPQDRAPENAEYMEQARKFFSTKALYEAFHQPKNSTQTVVFLTPEQYIQLTDFGDVYLDVAMVEGFINKSVRYESLPYLGVETDEEDNSVYVSLDGQDHAGRRMMKTLLGLGLEKVPVVINSQQYNDGPVYQWGMTTKRPSVIEGPGDVEFAFPQTETY
jgi:hypothetical protein